MGDNAAQQVLDQSNKNVPFEAGSFTAAVINEIAGESGAAASRAQQVSGLSELSSKSSIKEFGNVVLTGFVQDGNEQLRAQEKSKTEPAKDKPMTREEQIKDAKERGELLLKDSLAGKWSSKSQETWKNLFNDLTKIPGMTAEKAAALFNNLGSRINDNLEKQGVEHRVGMAVMSDDATGKTSITMQINGEKTRASNLQSVLTGKDTPTNVKAGEFKFAPEKEQVKPKARASNRMV